VLLSLANTHPILNLLITTNNLLDKALYTPKAKYLQQASKEDRIFQLAPLLVAISLGLDVTTQEEQGSRSVGRDPKVYSTINRYN
jgi:hypothetical protein